MKNKNDIKKIIIYTFVITPLLLALMEIGLELIRKKQNNLDKDFKSKVAVNFLSKRNSRITYDPISGWRHNCNLSLVDKGQPSDLICNRHGFILTPYQSNKKTNKNTYGLLLLGNSVAMGEGLNSKYNKKTFASQLEVNLREKDKSIDVVNVAYSGYNTWQEHIETIRYLNSSPMHDDLPDIKMIVSFGGIQDFWNLMRLMSNKNTSKAKDYKYANGLMIHMSNIKYINAIRSSYEGNIPNTIKAFISSVKARSNIINLINNFKVAIENSDDNKSNRHIFKINIRGIEPYESLEEVINARFNMKMSEYINLRDYFVNSVVRNITANSNLIEDGKYVYVYAPTYFSSFNNEANKQTWAKGIDKLIDREGEEFAIYEKEIKVLEKDYRDSLLKKLTQNKNIEVLDYSLSSKHIWFTDYSHFNEFGAYKISSKLANDLYKFIKRINN